MWCKVQFPEVTNMEEVTVFANYWLQIEQTFTAQQTSSLIEAKSDSVPCLSVWDQILRFLLQKGMRGWNEVDRNSMCNCRKPLAPGFYLKGYPYLSIGLTFFGINQLSIGKYTQSFTMPLSDMYQVQKGKTIWKYNFGSVWFLKLVCIYILLDLFLLPSAIVQQQDRTLHSTRDKLYGYAFWTFFGSRI